MCGPRRMIQHFQQAFRTCGVPSSRIHYEYFNFR
jgi:ferredoxin-NADP reductase